MTNLRTLLVAGLLAAAGAVGWGCTDNSGNGAGSPGSGGSAGSAGSSGTTGAGGGAGTTGAGGSSANFMAVAPCSTESAYATGTTINFPTSPTDFSYSPKCLKVSPGATVTFSGDFTAHPLAPSTHRGALTGNPITATATGTTKSFDFPTAGFYAYFCMYHDSQDTGNFMSGVIWVE